MRSKATAACHVEDLVFYPPTPEMSACDTTAALSRQFLAPVQACRADGSVPCETPLSSAARDLSADESMWLSLNAGHTPAVSPALSPVEGRPDLAESLTLSLHAGHTPAVSRSASVEPSPTGSAAGLGDADATITLSLHAGNTPAPSRGASLGSPLPSPGDTTHLSINAGLTPAASVGGFVAPSGTDAAYRPRATPAFRASDTSAAERASALATGGGRRSLRDVHFAPTTETLAPAFAAANPRLAAAPVAAGCRRRSRSSGASAVRRSRSQSRGSADHTGDVATTLVFPSAEAVHLGASSGFVYGACGDANASASTRRVTFGNLASSSPQGAAPRSPAEIDTVRGEPAFLLVGFLRAEQLEGAGRSAR